LIDDEFDDLYPEFILNNLSYMELKSFALTNKKVYLE